MSLRSAAAPQVEQTFRRMHAAGIIDDDTPEWRLAAAGLRHTSPTLGVYRTTKRAARAN